MLSSRRPADHQLDGYFSRYSAKPARFGVIQRLQRASTRHSIVQVVRTRCIFQLMKRLLDSTTTLVNCVTTVGDRAQTPCVFVILVEFRANSSGIISSSSVQNNRKIDLDQMATNRPSTNKPTNGIAAVHPTSN